MIPEAIIFDFDGVIADTERLHYDSFQEVLEPLGLGYDWEEYVAFYMSKDDRDGFRLAFERGGKPLDNAALRELIDDKAVAFVQLLESRGADGFPGTAELIREALQASLPIALCTGALRSDIAPLLPRLELEDAFAAVITANDVSRSKPDPESYDAAFEALKAVYPEITREITLAIEDSPGGVASAAAAGLHTLALTHSYPEEKLAAAERILPSLDGVSLTRLRELFENK